MQGLNYWVAPAVETKKVNSNRVVRNVCEHFNITKKELRSRCRLRNHVEARSIIGYILTKETPLVLREVGEIMNRDHATVLHYNSKVTGFMDVDQEYKELVNSFI